MILGLLIAILVVAATDLTINIFAFLDVRHTRVSVHEKIVTGPHGPVR